MTAPIDEEEIEYLDPIESDVEYLDESPKKKKNQSWEEYLKLVAQDVPIQGGKGLVKGFSGAYGNIASILGLNAPESEVRDEIRDEEQEALDVLNDPDATFMERFMANMAVSDDDDFIRQYAPLPTSSDIGELIDPYVGEAETMPGRFSERAGEFYGGSLALGMNDPTGALAASSAGQTVEEFGGGPLLQMGAEIAALLAKGTIQGKAASSNKEVQGLMNELRELGYTEEQITSAVNAAQKSGVWKFAKATNRAKGILEGTTVKSQELIEQTLNKAFPGLEEGLPSVREAASEIFSDAVEAGSKVPVKNVKGFTDKAKQVLKTFDENISALPDSQQAKLSKVIKNSIKKLGKGKPNADQLIELHKKFNQLGKWVDPKLKEKYLTELKGMVKESIGSESKGLLNKFENANKVYTQYKNAEKASELIGKAVDSEGFMNFSKLKNSLNNPKNRKNLEKWMGPKASQNLNVIAKVGKDIGDVSKKYYGLQNNLVFKMAKGSSLFHGLWTMNPKFIAAAVGLESAQRIATRSLTDPKFQGLYIKGLDAIRKDSPQLLQRATNQMERYLLKEGIIEDEDVEYL